MRKKILAATVLSLSLSSAAQTALALSQDEKNVAGALALLGIAAILHDKHHYREGYEPANEVELADFEAGYRDGLHNYAFNTSYGARSYNEGQAYNEGYSAGQHEREASHAHHQNRAAGHNASVPQVAVNACLDNASVQWDVPWQQVHVTKAKQAAAQDFYLELSAGRHSGVCEVAPDGQVYEFKSGHL